MFVSFNHNLFYCCCLCSTSAGKGYLVTGRNGSLKLGQLFVIESTLFLSTKLGSHLNNLFVLCLVEIDRLDTKERKA